MPRSRRPTAVATLTAVAAALSLAACTGDDDDDAAEPTDVPAVIDIQPTIETVPSHDPDFLPSILADEQVTADELATGYERYVQCLADGGAYGTYAYDLDLRSTLALDYQVAGDDGGENYSASLQAGCSRDFLSGLDERYFAANPAPDDLADRQRDSIVDCVETVDPAAVDRMPDAVTTDSAAPGFYVDSGTLDIGFLTDDPEALPELQRCFYSIGAEWRPFGTDPEPPATTSG